MRTQMSGCKCRVQTQSQCYYHHPHPLKKDLLCYASTFCHLVYNRSHTGAVEGKSRRNDCLKKGLASSVHMYFGFVSVALLCKPGVSSVIDILFIDAQTVSMKLLIVVLLHRAFLVKISTNLLFHEGKEGRGLSERLKPSSTESDDGH